MVELRARKLEEFQKDFVEFLVLLQEYVTELDKRLDNIELRLASLEKKGHDVKDKG